MACGVYLIVGYKPSVLKFGALGIFGWFRISATLQRENLSRIVIPIMGLLVLSRSYNAGQWLGET